MNLTFKITKNHILVFAKNKQLFKVSNNIHNAQALYAMCDKSTK